MAVRTSENTKNELRIGREPVVIFPLKKWKVLEEYFEDLEDSLRFKAAYEESKNKKGIDLGALKKKHNLK